MSQQQQSMPGGHYSGANPVPTIKQFVEKLDVRKKDRDDQIDSDSKRPGEHKESKLQAKKGQTVVTDPVTGGEVAIETAKKSMVDGVHNPTVSHRSQLSPHVTNRTQLSVPNANLGKDSVS